MCSWVTVKVLKCPQYTQAGLWELGCACSPAGQLGMNPGRAQQAGELVEQMCLSPVGRWLCSLLAWRSSGASASWRWVGNPGGCKSMAALS